MVETAEEATAQGTVQLLHKVAPLVIFFSNLMKKDEKTRALFGGKRNHSFCHWGS